MTNHYIINYSQVKQEQDKKASEKSLGQNHPSANEKATVLMPLLFA
ncbi:hypothetical protein HMPREF9176_1013 [Streptococcus downei F0415]|uniref:Uncharacterized protein n=1 Tax=Streptococcus downei MFe28 TaxID=764290 RepID=A0A380JB62_STRDO|nr:hypothetical protein HMPREF9176_1013 [Streptococcus downei F0415]SUN35308.1 Uncharacterised protein [Streptococcus downei MFe28]